MPNPEKEKNNNVGVMEVVELYVQVNKGFSPIKDFVHIALVKGLFCLLALPVIQEPGKSLIFHNLLQYMPIPCANNTSINA